MLSPTVSLAITAASLIILFTLAVIGAARHAAELREIRELSEQIAAMVEAERQREEERRERARRASGVNGGGSVNGTYDPSAN